MSLIRRIFLDSFEFKKIFVSHMLCFSNAIGIPTSIWTNREHFLYCIPFHSICSYGEISVDQVKNEKGRGVLFYVWDHCTNVLGMLLGCRGSHQCEPLWTMLGEFLPRPLSIIQRWLVQRKQNVG